MEISSPAFHFFEVLPVRFIADGGNFSPPLKWASVPLGTWELALTCEDMDDVGVVQGRGSLLHWLIYRIPPEMTGLREGLPRIPILSKEIGAYQGLNDFGTIGYTGPLPPVGDGLHRYAFTLYALDRETPLRAGATKQEFDEVIRNHVIQSARMVGLSRRDAAWNVA